MNAIDPIPNREPSLGYLVRDAEISLAELMRFEGLRADHCFVRLSVAGRSCGWESLSTTNTRDEERTLIDKIERSEKPVTDLVLAFIGVREHRGTKSLMAHIEYYRAGYPNGLLCGSHVRTISPSQKLEAYGNFLCFGGRQNSRI